MLNAVNPVVGDTDGTSEIHFRADMQATQLQPDPEMYSKLIAISTESERSSSLKVFASLDDSQYYELEGTSTKGYSTLKFKSNTDDKTSPPMAKLAQISYRDSSPQRCRLIQSAIITNPTTMTSPQ